MASYPTGQDNSQLMREAKIGFSIVLLVVSTVGYWGYSMYHKHQTQIPDHVRHAPMAQMIGPEEYLRSIEKNSSILAQRTNDPEPQHLRQDELLQPTNDNTRQASFVQPIVADMDQRTNLQSSSQPVRQNLRSPRATEQLPDAGRKRRLNHSKVKRAPKTDVQTTASSFLSKLNQTMAKVEALGSSEEKNGPPTDSLENSFVPSPVIPLQKVSSDDNKNTLNVAKDVSKELVTPRQPFSSAVEQADSLTEVSSGIEQGQNDFQSPSIAPTEDPLAPKRLIPSAEESDVSSKEPLEIDQLAAEDIVIEIEQPVGQQPVEPISEPENTGQFYLTKPGDSLWSVATEIYDDGRYFRALHEHNRAHVDDTSGLTVGTKLETPSVEILHQKYARHCPADQLQAGSCSTPSYTTAEGDTLFGIARKVTGQASRYLELYQLNRERLPSRINHLTRLPADIELVLPR